MRGPLRLLPPAVVLGIAGCVGFGDPQYWRDTHTGGQVYETYCLGCHNHKWYLRMPDFEIRSWVWRDPHGHTPKAIGLAQRDKEKIYAHLLDLKAKEERARILDREEKWVVDPAYKHPSPYYPGAPYERIDPEPDDPHPERPMAPPPVPAPGP